MKRRDVLAEIGKQGRENGVCRIRLKSQVLHIPVSIVDLKAVEMIGWLTETELFKSLTLRQIFRGLDLAIFYTVLEEVVGEDKGVEAQIQIRRDESPAVEWEHWWAKTCIKRLQADPEVKDRTAEGLRSIFSTVKFYLEFFAVIEFQEEEPRNKEGVNESQD